MLRTHNTQCDAENSEHYIIISALMQPLLVLWSSEDHYSHLIMAPKYYGLWKRQQDDLKHRYISDRTPDVTFHMATIFIPYLLLERSFFHVTDRLTWFAQGETVSLVCYWDGIQSFLWYSVDITFQFPVTHDNLDLKTLVMAACLAYIQIDCVGQPRPGLPTCSLPGCVVWLMATVGNHMHKTKSYYFCAMKAYRGYKFSSTHSSPWC
jgi:hypothetical protein